MPQENFLRVFGDISFHNIKNKEMLTFFTAPFVFIVILKSGLQDQGARRAGPPRPVRCCHLVASVSTTDGG